MDYEYLVSHCKVRPSTRPQVRRFRERLAVWKEWLSEDEHSIWTQIRRMLWADMVFRTINECRRMAIEDSSGNIQQNAAIASFIDEGYVANQLLAIRRLTEKDTRGDAISLLRILEDMKSNADLFTREVYVCHDGLPFDTTPARKRELERSARNAKRNGGVSFGYLPMRGPEAFIAAERMQNHFDRLIGASGGAWLRDDKLDPKVFSDLRRNLDCCLSINRYASKYIAHAADAGSRGELNRGERRITLNRLEVCQRAICKVAAYVHGPLLFIGSVGLVPLPPFQHLRGLEKAWIGENDLDKIHEYWKSRASEIEAWTNIDVESVCSEKTKN